MKQILTTCALVMASLVNSFAQAPVKDVTGNLNGTINWSADTIYMLKGKVYVKSGGTLNIEAGTIVKGDKSTPGSALIITRGAKIYAMGEATRPIVFTSSETPGNRAMGDWGGIAIAGNARVNVPGGIGTFEGGNLANPDGTTSDGQYGGLNDLDNSGELRYVRIEYAGFAYAPNSELNSLTMGGVGSGTKISYVQCSYGLDDAFEWFGGNVDADHLIAFRGNDDDFDTDFGHSGKVQFGVCMRDTLVADAVSGAMAFESDNDGGGSANGPKTSTIFSNMTLVGPRFTPTTSFDPNFRRGAHIRRNSEMSLFNSVVMGWPVGIKIDGDSCHRNADSAFLRVKNTVIAGCPTVLDSAAGSTPWGITPWYYTTGWGNENYANNTDLMLANPFNYSSPDFRPSTGSPLLSGAAFSDSKLAGFTSVAYRGAFGATDWTAGWANFRPDTSAYLNGLTGPNSVNQLTASELSITMYPNPAQQSASLYFTLNKAGSVSVTVTDLNGKLMYRHTDKLSAGSQELTLNTSSWSNGMYQVIITGDHIQGRAKLSVIK
jgi:hypothetical protein